MQTAFDITMTGRKVLEKFLDGYSPAQLNIIPEGFNNNLIWNIGHVVVVQQMLVYGLSGLPMMVSPEMIALYKKGSRPEADATEQDIDLVRSLLYDPVLKTQVDYDEGVFVNYNEFTTMTGHTLRSASDAIAFNYYHEALHTGIMMSIRKFV